MPKQPHEDPKFESLREQGALHSHPQAVRDELFAGGDFFDARDLVQVKYEMLRRVEKEGSSVTEAATAFGFSRPSYYQAEAAFQAAGLPGLVPLKRGPKEGHKLTAEVMDFVGRILMQEPSLPTAGVTSRIQERFGLVVHRRTIERALARRQKKRRKPARGFPFGETTS
jgi:transposase